MTLFTIHCDTILGQFSSTIAVDACHALPACIHVFQCHLEDMHQSSHTRTETVARVSIDGCSRAGGDRDCLAGL